MKHVLHQKRGPKIDTRFERCQVAVAGHYFVFFFFYSYRTNTNGNDLLGADTISIVETI